MPDVYIGIITAELDIILRQGDFHRFEITFYDPNNSNDPYDLTVFSGGLVLEARKTKGKGTADIILEETAGELVVSGADDNILALRFDESKTGSCQELYYDIKGTDGEGIKTILEGKLTFTRDA